jgi:gluconolactonase
MRYELGTGGVVLSRDVFFRISEPEAAGGADGMKVDANGNLFATGPGGILVISPEGRHLGTITLPESPSNLAFDKHFKNLFVTARSTIYKIVMK